MKKFLAAASAVSLLAMAAPAFAQSIEGSIGYSDIDLEGASLGSVTARLNYGLTNIFGIEGEASFGVKDVSATATDPGPPPTTVTGTIEMKHQLAVYGTASLPLGETGRVFARVGYGTQKFESSITGLGAFSGSEESWNYGVGGQVMLFGANGVRVDYTKYDIEDLDADVWSISYVRKFR